MYFKATIGSLGAPTLVAASSKGITSITRNSAGDYTVRLTDKYVGFLTMSVKTQNASGISASPDVNLKAIGVTSATPTFEFVCSVGGVATDPASGDTLYGQITLKKSTAF